MRKLFGLIVGALLVVVLVGIADATSLSALLPTPAWQRTPTPSDVTIQAAGAHLSLAFTHYASGEYDEAIEEFGKVIESGRDAASVYRWFAQAHIENGNPDGALERLSEILSANPLNAAAHYGVGKLYMDAYDDPENAKWHFDRALEIDPNLGLAHNGLGVLLSGQGNKEEALEKYRIAIIADPSETAAVSNLLGLQRSGMTPEELIAQKEEEIISSPNGDFADEARYLLGVGYLLLQDYDAVLTEWRNVIDKHSLSRWADNAQAGITLVYLVTGEYESAAAEALIGLRDYSGTDTEGTLHLLLATSNFMLGDYPAARAGYELVLNEYPESLIVQEAQWKNIERAIQTIDRGSAEADRLVGEAYRLFEEGDNEQALLKYSESLAVAQEHGYTEGEADAHHGIGRSYALLGQYERAIEQYESYAKACQRMGDTWREGRAYLYIGGVYGRLEQPDMELHNTERALDLARSANDRTGEAMALSNLGSVYHEWEDYDRALELMNEALAIFKELGSDPYFEQPTLLNIGVLHLVRGELGEAEQYLSESLRLAEEEGDQLNIAWSLNALAAVREELGDKVGALDLYQQSLALIEKIETRVRVPLLSTEFVEVTRTLFDGRDVYADAIALAINLGQPETAFALSERSRARVFLNLIGNQGIDAATGEEPSLLRQELELRRDISGLEVKLREEWSRTSDQRDQSAIDQISASLEVLRQEYEDLLIKIQIASPEYASLVTVVPFGIEESQALLQLNTYDTTLISYYVGWNELTIFVIGPQTFAARTVEVSWQQLYQQLSTLDDQMKLDPLLGEAWQEPARSLYEWLIATVKEYLPESNGNSPQRLGIIPHDLLHYAPFGLLYNGQDVLLAEFTLFYAPSASSLQYVIDKPHRTGDSLMAFAVPDSPGLPSLRNAIGEVQAIAALFEAQPFIGADATESLLKAQAGQHDLVHIAAHSAYEPLSPQFSSVLLSGDDSEDGRLETHEIFNLDLSKTDLVVLSACATHWGEWSAGDELVGMERAFLRAGASSIVTTLWPVDDVATARLMERFYTNLQEGQPKADALRMAQVETRKEQPEPYFWAGFLLVGDPGPSLVHRPPAQQTTPAVNPVSSPASEPMPDATSSQPEASGEPLPSPAKGGISERMYLAAAALISLIGLFSWLHGRERPAQSE